MKSTAMHLTFDHDEVYSDGNWILSILFPSFLFSSSQGISSSKQPAAMVLEQIFF